MKVAGFTFIKNALTYDYPIVEAIKSILPICDEFIVAVGNSDDDTMGLINSIDSDKIRIIETKWDETQREGGRVLALETDKAFAEISEDVDWAFYIQGDEVMHEKYLEVVKKAMLDNKDDLSIDGLLFNYAHFYGSYDYVGTSSNWYTNEIRVVRNSNNIYSYRDAQGFRKDDDQKLTVRAISAWMYHYGWVKEPKAMQRKQENFHKLWHDDKWVEENVAKAEEFDYTSEINELKTFDGSHPEVMSDRISSKNWKFEHDISFNKKSVKDKFKLFCKNSLGLDFYYKNYRIKK